MIHRIARLAPALAANGAGIGVAEATPGEDIRDRLRHLLPPDRIPADKPLVLLWRGGKLSSPDTVALTSATRSEFKIDAQIELRRFDGALHANLVTIPVVEIPLGTLEPGRYDVSIEVTELWFEEYGHPQNAARPTTRRAGFIFVVAAVRWDGSARPNPDVKS